jgi:hypothetical protein
MSKGHAQQSLALPRARGFLPGSWMKDKAVVERLGNYATDEVHRPTQDELAPDRKRGRGSLAHKGSYRCTSQAALGRDAVHGALVWLNSDQPRISIAGGHAMVGPRPEPTLY